MLNTFKNDLRNELPKFIPANITIEEKEIAKANQCLHALIFKMPECCAAPTMYIEDLFEAYKAGGSITEIAKCIADVVENSAEMARNVSDNFMPDTWDGVKDRLSVRLIGIEKNQKFLDDVPYKYVGGGLALIAEVVGDEIIDGYVSAVVNSGLLDDFGVSKETLLETALKSSEEHDPAVMKELSATLFGGQAENLLDQDEKIPEGSMKGMYILTNKEGFFGAKCLFYPGVMEKAASLLGGSYYILPSSIHEVLFVPEDPELDKDRLITMVSEANSTIVDEKDILATAVYRYDAEKNVFEQIA